LYRFTANTSLCPLQYRGIVLCPLYRGIVVCPFWNIVRIARKQSLKLSRLYYDKPDW
jgi:hypothetical protein